MLPPNVYAEAASNADAHIQLAIERITPEQGIALVEGTIVRVFRGDPTLVGCRSQIRIPYALPGQEAHLRPGESLGPPLSKVLHSRVVEAYVNVSGNELSSPYDMTMLLDAAFDTPQYPAPVAQPELKPSVLRARSVEIGFGLFFFALALWLYYATR